MDVCEEGGRGQGEGVLHAFMWANHRELDAYKEDDEDNEEEKRSTPNSIQVNAHAPNNNSKNIKNIISSSPLDPVLEYCVRRYCCPLALALLTYSRDGVSDREMEGTQRKFFMKF